jgi:hypothetical protein
MTKYKFGKLPPKNDYRTLRFKKYLKADIAQPPASDDVLQRIYANLKVNESDLSTLFPMDANDTLGDCTCAGLAHADTVFNGLIGKQNIMVESDVKDLYSKLGGQGDSGLAMLDVLNYWRNNIVSGDEVLAFVKIHDPKNHELIEQAIYLFGCVYLGFQCQQDVQNLQKPWTQGPLTNDGHCVVAVAYDQKGVTVLTWGQKQKGTWGWWDECVDEAYVLLPPEARNPEFAPGFDFQQLEDDLDNV